MRFNHSVQLREWLALAICAVSFAVVRAEAAQPVPFADNGGLKMLYDNRQYPQAVADRAATVYPYLSQWSPA